MFSNVHLKGDFYIVYVQDKFPVLFPENKKIMKILPAPGVLLLLAGIYCIIISIRKYDFKDDPVNQSEKKDRTDTERKI